MPFSNRINHIKPSATLSAKLKALELKAKGVDVVNLSAGEPSFFTPDKIKEACKKAINENWSLYGPVNGFPELRQAVADCQKRTNGLDISPDAVVMSCGAKQGIYATLQILINPGDEVLIPAPYWVTYPSQVELAEGIPVTIKTAADTDFKLQPDRLRTAITPKTKLLILNTPSNPTGCCYTEEELKKIGEICAEKNIWVLSDEIYDQLTFDDFQHVSFLKAAPFHRNKTVLVNGASKSYAMTGWRVGYVIGPQAFVGKLKNFQGQEITSLPTFIQRACIVAFGECDEEAARMRKVYEERRNRAFSLLTSIKGVRCYKPKGAFYLFPEVSYYNKPTPELVDYFLEEAHVSVIAGDNFGAPGYFRLSFVAEMKEIEKGIERIKSALGKL